MNNENIYSTPSTDVELQPSESNSSSQIIGELKSQSTWLLFFITVLTLGIYMAYYIQRQTGILNRQLESKDQISEGLVKSIVILTYVSVALVIPYIIMDYAPTIDRLGNLTNNVLTILLIVWAFKARNRMNTLLGSLRKTPHWFHGFWTFLFQACYFNYKINVLNEKEGQSVISNP